MNAERIAHYQEIAQRAWALESPKIAMEHDPIEPMLTHHFKTTGKLLRPALAIAGYDLIKGQLETPPRSHPAAVLRAALSAEVLHNGTLIHDDLQDGDEVRRAQPTVWKQYSPYQAINAGSYLYFQMTQLLAKLQLPPAQTLRLIEHATAGALAIIAGQAAEKELWHAMKTEAYEDARKAYFQVVQQKTSALFDIPLTLGAILADASDAVITALQTIARPLGTLFQIQDDVLDLYGEKGREAKGNDLAEGKPSFLVLYGIHYASDADATRLKALIEQDRKACQREEIDWAITMLKECGALDAALGLMEQLRQQVLQRSRQPPLLPYNPQAVSFFDGICQKVMAPIAHLETF
jgi:geranylgeranyl pyrophosphate synthase